jgi:hypothetical protein
MTGTKFSIQVILGAVLLLHKTKCIDHFTIPECDLLLSVLDNLILVLWIKIQTVGRDYSDMAHFKGFWKIPLSKFSATH